MNIEVNCEYKEDLIASVPVAELAAFVLSQEDCPQNAEVSVSFVDDDEMARLNRVFRGKTGPTDVLSFECDGLDDEMGGECGVIPGMPFELGDVIVAVDVAERQTEQFGTTFE
uniref:rRNA maturation RNase YbeY n=1 Tax=Ellagibacter isourolithinifaciens TaxID=2137581 RepID=UPI003A935A58